ncbi:SIR2 family protein [Ferroacidibacillus organovorans]|uniref:Uncharacterized protein n=1 Tax=Ferroacidibacillus organovorans TaxID=1765683 RepID=A0A1V4EVK9_9BACL|nr:SIR2 family protein [Ferroacidibacillus organovorans]OPG16959.1 hypothetical protein B2M26_03890 [Ferroacidibacillus organovorans]
MKSELSKPEMALFLPWSILGGNCRVVHEILRIAWFEGILYMNVDEGLQELQRFLRTKPIVLVGTGLSMSMGLPGMPELLTHLRQTIPDVFSGDTATLAQWASCLELIDKHGFEGGLGRVHLSDNLLKAVIQEAVRLVRPSDQKFGHSLAIGERTEFPFARLLKHLVQSLSPSNQTLDVVTPNYDHLVEYACDLIQVSYQTGFQGGFIKRFDPTSFDEHYYIPGPPLKNRPSYRQVPRVRLLKPHGSLYWRRFGSAVVETQIDIDSGESIIITPGSTKYEASLTDSVMNRHRELANQCILRAESVLVIGYGFNDDHLQTVLYDRIKDGMECLVLTKVLSEQGRQWIKSFPNMIALEQGENDSTTRWYARGSYGEWDGRFWSLDYFVHSVIG